MRAFFSQPDATETPAGVYTILANEAKYAQPHKAFPMTTRTSEADVN